MCILYSPLYVLAALFRGFIYRILQKFSYIIEFIKREEEEINYVRLAEHFIAFLQQVK